MSKINMRTLVLILIALGLVITLSGVFSMLNMHKPPTCISGVFGSQYPDGVLAVDNVLLCGRDLEFHVEGLTNP